MKGHVTRTKMGTLCSARWSADWIAVVEDVEASLGRRICGAELGEGYPCELEGIEPTGRCRFHGGVEHSGAQSGNANALRHALYSRRMRPCGKGCPHWKRCPMAGADVEGLDDSVRPECVYERSEFDATMEELRALLGASTGGEDGGKDKEKDRDKDKEVQKEGRVGFFRLMALRAGESYAMARVMSQRAGDLSGISDAVHGINRKTKEGEFYWQTRVSSFVEAGVKLTREERMWHRRLMEAAEKYFLAKDELERTERKRERKTTEEEKAKTKKKIDHDYDHDCDHDCGGKKDGVVVPREKGGGKAKSGSVGWISGGSKGSGRKKELTRADFMVGLNAGPGADATANIIDAHARAVASGIQRE